MAKKKYEEFLAMPQHKNEGVVIRQFLDGQVNIGTADYCMPIRLSQNQFKALKKFCREEKP